MWFQQQKYYWAFIVFKGCWGCWCHWKAAALESTKCPEPVLGWRGGKDDLLGHDHHLLLQKGFFTVEYIRIFVSWIYLHNKLYVLSEVGQAGDSYSSFFCVLHWLLRTSRMVWSYLFSFHYGKKLIQVNPSEVNWVSDIYVLRVMPN